MSERGKQGEARTVGGSGASTEPDVKRAVTAAVRAALASLEGRPAALGFLFAAPEHDLGQALETAHALAPTADFLACSTAGELTERGLTHGGVACLLIVCDGVRHLLRAEADMSIGAAALADALASGFADAIDQHAAAGRGQSTTLLFGDGLSPTFEKLVAQIRRATSPTQQIVGAGAGDDGRLERTKVGAFERELPGGALALHVFSPRRWGVGVEHGVERITSSMSVTRASGNRVLELDGQPALEVYRRCAAEQGTAPEDATLGEFLMANHFGVLLFDDIVRVRAPIRVEPDGALFFAGEVPEGSSVCIVRSEPAQMFEAARRAARSAAEDLGRARAAGVLVFSCICRAQRLGARYADEIDCIREVFPDLPIAGFSSYGEIARTSAKLSGYHNSTIVVVAIPE